MEGVGVLSVDVGLKIGVIVAAIGGPVGVGSALGLAFPANPVGPEATSVANETDVSTSKDLVEAGDLVGKVFVPGVFPIDHSHA